MSRTRKAAVTAAFTYARFLMAIVPGILLLPLTLASLGARTYGLWLAFGEVLAYAAMIDPGVLSVLPWMIAEAHGSSDRASVRRLVWNGLATGAVAGAGYVLVVGALWLALPGALHLSAADRALLGPPIALVVAVTTLTYPLRVFRAALAGLQDVFFNGVLAIGEVVINVAVLATLLLQGYGLWALAWAAAAASIFVALASLARLAYLAPDLLTHPERPTLADLGSLLRNGIGAWLAAFGWQLLAASNGIVITYLGHPEWVPIYVCTAKMSTVLTQLSWVIPDSGLVGLAQLHGERPRSKRLRQMVGALVQVNLILGGAAACGVLAFNPAFVTRWVGTALFGGLRLNALLALGIIPYSLVHGLMTSAAVIGNRLRVGTATLANGVLQIGFAIVFGARWGLLGVAAAGLLAAAISTVPAGLVLLRSVEAIAIDDLVRDFLSPWARRAAATVAIAAGVSIVSQWMGVWIAATAAVLLGCAYLWHMRPLYRLLPLDPQWVPWLVSLRIVSADEGVHLAEQS